MSFTYLSMRALHLLLGLLLGLISPSWLWAQATGPDWQPVANKNGIKVYARQSPGSRFKEVKVNADMPGTLAQFVAVYSDVENYPNVIANTREARLLRRVSERELYYYVHSAMPWPATDRDLNMHVRFAYDAQADVLRVSNNAVSGWVPPQPERVRVPFWTGTWTVRSLDAQRLRIEYIFRVDPGGDLPAWVVNKAATVAPHKTFVQLREALRLPRYQNRAFSFLNPAP